MLNGLLIIVGCYLVGDIISGIGGIPIPGSVIGMGILFFFLLIKGHIPNNVEKVGDGLLNNLGIMFVPAGAGITMYLGLIAEEWDVILIASFCATIATFVTCGWLFQLFAKPRKEDQKNDD